MMIRVRMSPMNMIFQSPPSSFLNMSEAVWLFIFVSICRLVVGLVLVGFGFVLFVFGLVVGLVFCVGLLVGVVFPVACLVIWLICLSE